MNFITRRLHFKNEWLSGHPPGFYNDSLDYSNNSCVYSIPWCGRHRYVFVYLLLLLLCLGIDSLWVLTVTNAIEITLNPEYKRNIQKYMSDRRRSCNFSAKNNR
ncbi:hypothetical protein HYPSUDRAFT_919869 [Hypholoma sublateritium FD-334 SS-4]|uniref:Uncharacterized protein n=1 Tax=Hypholoma sublateritium (strain FD-334 SS-4) TaxID=945553 RepID=A0A0D2NIE0_HYPSF|nr:hypothetical protein HYPSUDRAFT_919869 [Hypholoma sublateritium FD-334 SS-4]